MIILGIMMQDIYQQVDGYFVKKNLLSDVRRFGTFSMAYLTLQEGIEEFRDSFFEGFIGFKKYWEGR